MYDFIPGNIENVDNDFFEAMLRQAVIKNHFDEMAAIPSEEELSKMYTFSDEHNRKMQKIFSADKKREVFKVVIRWSKVVAVAACACMTLTFGALLTSAEVRNAIGDVIVTWFEKFTEFRSTDLSEEFTILEWKPEYLPEGFGLSESVGATGYIYTNDENIRIIFDYKPSDFSVSADNEDMEYSAVTVNDVVYNIFMSTIKDDEYADNIIIWDMDEYRFTVLGNIEIDELLKIALSVK